jgi:hypothetical protein
MGKHQERALSKRDKKSMLVPVREPNGRLQRPTADAIEAVSPAVVKRLRDAAVLGMRDAEWGTELGRLFLMGEIAGPDFTAGKRWGNLVVAYHLAIGAKPPYPKAMSFERRNPSPEPDAESDKAKQKLKTEIAIIDDMREAHAVLIGAGMLAERAVRAICEQNDASVGIFGIANLQRGLAWLALHWGLSQQSKKHGEKSNASR